MELTDIFIGEQDTSTHRVCGTCGQLKPLEAFYKDGRDSNGNVRYRRDCRACYKNTRIKERKYKNK